MNEKEIQLNNSQLFFIKTFKLIDLNGHLLCQCNDSFTLIKDSEMKTAVKNLQNHSKDILSMATLKQYLGCENFSNKLSFVANDLAILTAYLPNYYLFENFVFVSDYNDLLNDAVIKELSSKTRLKHLTLNEITSNTLIISIQTKYDEEHIKSLYKLIEHQSNIGFISSYIFNRDYVIDGLYLPERKTACHYCYMDYLQGKSYTPEGAYTCKWLDIYNLCKESSNISAISSDITNLEYYYCLNTLNRNIQNFLSFEEDEPIDIRNLFSMKCHNLNDLTVVSDIIPHSLFCQCIKTRSKPCKH